MAIGYFTLALAMGALLSIYLPMISQSARFLGSGPLANVPFFLIASAASILIALGTGSRAADFARIPSVPPLLLTAGIMSACMIIGSTFLIPRIGIGAFFVLLVSGQVLAGLIFGYFGLFGVAATELTAGKVAGAALVIAGVWLVTFR